MTEFNVAPMTALLIDGEANEMFERRPEVFDLFDVDPRFAVITALVLEDCMKLWGDSKAFHLRVAAWRQAARDFAARYGDT